MAELENLLPNELMTGSGAFWLGDEVVLPYAAAVRAVEIATEHQIAILGVEAFEIEEDGWVKPHLLTVDLSDASATIKFT